ncbi:MAG: hypothetical protein ACD_51C00205G0006 [uncultured bacterium]|nr:MAG: hypothetical protein ACD_51C00205G0006 [uncultured bacterium]OGJ49002.1 MAG: hypothetical protein A2344_00500 [Candidatus Peregrinibacteria bacterium RIFOXYB12_FULL_41_12]
MMENMKKKEWVKLLGAFVVGALLMLAVTGAGGALWQGKLTTTTTPPPFTVSETVVTAGSCTTTACDLATQLSSVSSSLAGAIDTTNTHYIPTAVTTLSDQIDMVSSALAIGISGSQVSLSTQMDMISRGLLNLIRDTCGE